MSHFVCICQLKCLTLLARENICKLVPLFIMCYDRRMLVKLLHRSGFWLAFFVCIYSICTWFLFDAIGTRLYTVILGNLFIAFMYARMRDMFLHPLQELITSIKEYKSGEPFLFNTSKEHPIIQEVGDFVTWSIEAMHHVQTDVQEGKLLKSEVELASEMQKYMMNQKYARIDHLEIVANSKPVWEIWGDSYDIISHRENHYIYLWDVTGHWVASGFVMAMVNSLIMSFSSMLKNAAQILIKTNEILTPRIQSAMMMTLLMLRWNGQKQQLYIAWAWHESLLIYRASTKKVETIRSWGVALGMKPDIHKFLEERKIDFQIGDIAVLYSDGILEASGLKKNKEHFGMQRFVRTIESYGKKWWAVQLFQGITSEISKYMTNKPRPHDDMTLMCIGYCKEKHIPSPHDEEVDLVSNPFWMWTWDWKQ